MEPFCRGKNLMEDRRFGGGPADILSGDFHRAETDRGGGWGKPKGPLQTKLLKHVKKRP